MHLTLQRERAAAPARDAALSTTTNPTYDSGDTDGIADDAALAVLRRQFAAIGLSVYRLLGSELAVTGSSSSWCLPDERCAWAYLRHLRGVQHGRR